MRLEVTNSSEQVTSIHVRAAESAYTLGSLTDLAPGLSREIVARLAHGNYVVESGDSGSQPALETTLHVTGVGNPYALLGEDAEVADAASRSLLERVMAEIQTIRAHGEVLSNALGGPDLNEARQVHEVWMDTWYRMDALQRAIVPSETPSRLSLTETDFATR